MQHLHIANVTRGTVLAHHAACARTFWARFRGLMGRSSLAPGSGLVIEPNNSVHTFWMRFAIDVVFVDRADRVVGVAPNMLPNRPYAGARAARRTLELPAGTIARSATCVGDQLLFAPCA